MHPMPPTHSSTPSSIEAALPSKPSNTMKKFIMTLVLILSVSLTGWAQTVSTRPSQTAKKTQTKTTEKAKTTSAKTSTTADAAKKTSSATSKTSSATSKTESAATAKAAATEKAATPATSTPKPSTPATSTGTTAATAGYLCNLPLPYLPAKLDILFIGNSFSIDTNAQLPSILSSLGINTVNVYVLYKGACSMREHYEYYLNDKPVYQLFHYNATGEKKLSDAINIREAMRLHPYDVVVFQQYSLESGDYKTYEPYLSLLIQGYKITTISPRTTFAFNQTWAYSSQHKQISRYGSQQHMWEQICHSVRKMREVSGIDIVIPCGTAIQNARTASTLTSTTEFTRDTQHLDLYQGRYIAACTFFESIIGPCLQRSIRDDLSILGAATDENQVNNKNRRILQNCARLAVANNYSISHFAGQ